MCPFSLSLSLVGIHPLTHPSDPIARPSTAVLVLRVRARGKPPFPLESHPLLTPPRDANERGADLSACQQNTWTPFFSSSEWVLQ